MIVLAIESSTAAGSVAISKDRQVLAFEKSMSQRTHSEFINPAIEKCLQKSGVSLSQVDVFAVGIGPGSFTGIRVAINIGMTFAMTFQKPMVAMTSLEILKVQSKKIPDLPSRILCLINAHKNMCYLSFFEKDKTLVEPTALPIKDIESLILKTSDLALGLGDGFKAYEKLWSSSFLKQIRRDQTVEDHPLATTLSLCAEDLAKRGQTIEWKLVKPLYIRASEAEENLRVNT